MQYDKAGGGGWWDRRRGAAILLEIGGYRSTSDAPVLRKQKSRQVIDLPGFSLARPERFERPTLRFVV